MSVQAGTDMNNDTNQPRSLQVKRRTCLKTTPERTACWSIDQSYIPSGLKPGCSSPNHTSFFLSAIQEQALNYSRSTPQGSHKPTYWNCTNKSIQERRLTVSPGVYKGWQPKAWQNTTSVTLAPKIAKADTRREAESHSGRSHSVLLILSTAFAILVRSLLVVVSTV
jgi:hypothetical protein